MTLNEMTQKAHEMSRAKGWYEGPPRSALEMHMLMVSELAEATECVRARLPPVYFEAIEDGSPIEPVDLTPEAFTFEHKIMSGSGGCMGKEQRMLKPEGEAVELADVAIRLMDYFAARGWDFEKTVQLKMAYNSTRPHRHGGKAL